MSKPIITNELREKYTAFQISKLEQHVPVIKQCSVCNCEFDAQSYVFRPTAIYPRVNEFCSSDCRKTGAGHKNKKVFRNYVCCHCGQEYTPRKDKVRQQFCSIKCRSLHLKNRPRPEVQRWIHKITPPKSSVSIQEKQWLQQFEITHYQHLIKINNRSFRVDGYNEHTNTIYEYFGSFWHGNPDVYDQQEINPVAKVTFGELYANTIKRIKLFEYSGYTVVYQWSIR